MRKARRDFDILQTARLYDHSYTTKGSDPTFTQVYRLRRYSDNKEVVLTEFFGEWTIDIGEESYRGLKTGYASNVLIQLGFPTIHQIEARVAAEDEEEYRQHDADPMNSYYGF